jgi:hypothetical protein
MEPTIDQHQAALANAQAAGDDAAVARISKKIRDAHAGAYQAASEAGDVQAADRIAAKYRETRGADWSRESANSDPMWINNAKTLYSEVEKKPFEGDDKTAAEWLKGYMSDFNYRLLGSEKLGLRNTLGIAGDVKNFSPKAKAAFLTSMDDFDALPTFSGEGAVEAGKRVLTDPSTLIGIGGLGAGEAAVQGAKEAAMIGTKQLLKSALRRVVARSATAAVEGAAASGLTDAARQEAEIGGGREQEFDPMRTVKAAGTGAAVAGTIGAVTGGVSAARASRKNKVVALASDKINKDSDMAAMEAEHVMDLKGALDDPTKRRNTITVKEANAVAKDYSDTAVSLAKRSKLSRVVKEQIQDASLNPRATSERELQRLEQGSTEGAAVASAIRKMKLSESLTARDEGGDNIVKRGIRGALDFIPMPPALARAGQQILRAPKRSELINDSILSKRNVAVAQNVLDRTGPSSASTGLDVLRDRANRARILDETTAKAQDLAKVAAQNRKVAAQNLQKEGFDVLQDGDLGKAADWLDANRDNLTAGQYQSYAQKLIAKKKALDKAAGIKSPTGNKPAPKAPRAPQSARAGTAEPGTDIRDIKKYELGTARIQKMEEDVLNTAKGMPAGSKLRVAHEGYIRALRTTAKKDQGLRDEALDAAMEHLSPDEQDILWANVQKLDEHFKTMTADDLKKAVKKAK